MRLGIHLPQYGRAASPEAIRDVAIRAEALGFADVWVSDHILQPAGQGYPSPYLFDALLTLGWAAAVTERVRLGTSVLVIPQYHPLQLANSLASLDRLSGGRVTIVGGVGWSRAEYAALDQDFATRGARMDEALALMRAVWTDDPASFHGRHYDVTDVRVLPQPVGTMPIWIGGSSPAALRRAVAADGYQGISTSPADLAPVIAALRAERPGDFGEELRGPPASNDAQGAGLPPGSTAASRRDSSSNFTISYRTGWDPQGMDPGLIREERDAYAAAGVEHVVAAPWRTSGDDWIRSMELLVEIVHG